MYRKFHRLRVRFAELDMSQAEAARRAGIPPSTLTARMTGRLPFTARDISGLCKALDLHGPVKPLLLARRHNARFLSFFCHVYLLFSFHFFDFILESYSTTVRIFLLIAICSYGLSF